MRKFMTGCRRFVGRQAAAVVTVAAFALVALVGSALAAAGGTTVAGAVAFTPGKTISTSTEQGAGVNFFKVTAGYGDLLSIGFGVPTAFQSDRNVVGVGMCLLPLGTDDFTLSQARCLTSLENNNAPNTQTKLEVSYRILRAGTYTFAIGDHYCVAYGPSVSLPCSDNGRRPPVPYELRVMLQAYTTMTLQAPATARAHGSVVVRGLLKGRNVGGTKIAIQIRHGGAWKAVGIARASSSGQFSAKVPIGAAGRYALRAVYAGDGSHQASRASATVVAN